MAFNQLPINSTGNHPDATKFSNLSLTDNTRPQLTNQPIHPNSFNPPFNTNNTSGNASFAYGSQIRAKHAFPPPVAPMKEPSQISHVNSAIPVASVAPRAFENANFSTSENITQYPPASTSEHLNLDSQQKTVPVKPVPNFPNSSRLPDGSQERISTQQHPNHSSYNQYNRGSDASTVSAPPSNFPNNMLTSQYNNVNDGSHRMAQQHFAQPVPNYNNVTGASQQSQFPNQQGGNFLNNSQPPRTSPFPTGQPSQFPQSLNQNREPVNSNFSSGQPTHFPPNAPIQNRETGTSNFHNSQPSHFAPHASNQNREAPPMMYSGHGAAAPTSAAQGNFQQPGAPQNTTTAYSSQKSSSRLDPDAIPSPITVINEDQKTHGGNTFYTSQPGIVPPLCTTKFKAIDNGYCSPRYIRSTLYSIPVSKDLANNSRIPICLAIKPMAELEQDEIEPPLADVSLTTTPVRCNRCKAYMCPGHRFIDGGRRYVCSLCGCQNDTPNEYFNHLEHSGRRIDAFNRPELCLGSYEFPANIDYCKNQKPPKPPVYIFMIEVSYNSIKSGLVSLLCQKLKTLLHMLPKEANAEKSLIRIGLATYTNVIHFYNLQSQSSKPQMQIVSDVSDMFLPSLNGFLVDVEEAKELIEKVLDSIPLMFEGASEVDTVLGPVIQAGLDAIKSIESCGKLLIFHTSLPMKTAPGCLKNREDKKILATDKEKQLLQPQTNFYSKLGIQCVEAGCSIDLFLFPNLYVDVASLADICKITGGHIYKYQYFSAELDSDQFVSDLARNLQRPCVFDAMMRIRTNTGIRPVDFIGHMHMPTAQNAELAALDCDQTILVELKHDDKLDESAGVHVQVALLYTSVAGVRRIRVHNASFTCATQLTDVFKSCEADVLINSLSKQASRALLHKTPKQVKEDLVNLTAQTLACYRKNCASPSSPGQLILPESMKLLPVYVNSLMKSTALFGGPSEITVDDRSFLMNLISGLDVSSSLAFFYPRLIPVHNLLNVNFPIPGQVRCAADKLLDDGAFILENGLIMFLWIGMNVSNDWCSAIFGVKRPTEINREKRVIPKIDNPLNEALLNIISQLRQERKKYMKLFIIGQGDKLEFWFKQFLVEDGVNPSYVDFLCHIHKEIRQLLS